MEHLPSEEGWAEMMQPLHDSLATSQVSTDRLPQLHQVASCHPMHAGRDMTPLSWPLVLMHAMRVLMHTRHGCLGPPASPPTDCLVDLQQVTVAQCILTIRFGMLC